MLRLAYPTGLRRHNVEQSTLVGALELDPGVPGPLLDRAPYSMKLSFRQMNMAPREWFDGLTRVAEGVPRSYGSTSMSLR
jgi:hypothetical protein